MTFAKSKMISKTPDEFVCSTTNSLGLSAVSSLPISITSV
jgi:hypothetical protein